jgi:hypothetical protein
METDKEIHEKNCPAIQYRLAWLSELAIRRTDHAISKKREKCGLVVGRILAYFLYRLSDHKPDGIRIRVPFHSSLGIQGSQQRNTI